MFTVSFLHFSVRSKTLSLRSGDGAPFNFPSWKTDILGGRGKHHLVKARGEPLGTKDVSAREDSPVGSRRDEDPPRAGV